MTSSLKTLSEKWVGYIAFTHDSIYVAELTIEQSVNEIRGVLTFTSGRHEGKKYSIRGRFDSNILTFNYYAEDTTATSQGATTLMFDGHSYLGGLFAFYSEQSNSIGIAEGKFLPVSMADSMAKPFVIAKNNVAKRLMKHTDILKICGRR